MTHGPQGGRRATAHEKDTMGRQARYTETGPRHRNRNETGTETPEQRSTGTRDANTIAAMHANAGNTMHGNRARERNREEGVSKVEETRNKGAHDKLAKIPVAANVEYEGYSRWNWSWNRLVLVCLTILVPSSTKQTNPSIATYARQNIARF
ncbi:hypothetical protein ARMSODRAFT_1007385 [Armillaria solidipes]|uniref:Uncharacterized protein n=1 Tax=Armillaria solidipes TaxID=1076256 RepID=A0A2H3BHM6_9AGAR|nr:hypothetical protein ARMSODRAFT_1007385 [Armillaria solidipes]